MKNILALLAGASVPALMIAAPAAAQSNVAPVVDQAAAPPAAAHATVDSREGVVDSVDIIVTARRQAERLQDVPQTVVPISGGKLQDLQIRRLADISTLVPGLQVDGINNTLRGVTYNYLTAADSTIATYLNDAPVQQTFVLQGQGIYDSQQVEVLKGPQGTTRGISTPSGAITVTTRRPNLTSFGGYADGTVATHDRDNFEGAVNIPLINDVLAARISGLYQRDDSGPRSVNSTIKPSSVTKSVRASLRYEPTDRFRINLLYQYLQTNTVQFTPVVGPSDGLAVNPTLTAQDRLAVSDLPSAVSEGRFHFVTANAEWDLGNNRLTYVGSYSYGITPAVSGADTANTVPGFDINNSSDLGNKQMTHEIRFASQPKPGGRFLDYTLGAFYSRLRAFGPFYRPVALLPGAFGEGALPDTQAYSSRYLIALNGVFPSVSREFSLFGSATAHLGKSTELTAGVRQIFAKTTGYSLLTTTAAFAAFPSYFVGGDCALAGAITSGYPGFCDQPIPAATVSNVSSNSSAHPVIYNVSLSHHFNQNLLVYGTTGTSWQRPVQTIGLQGNFAGSSDERVRDLALHPAETSTSYEVGVKSTLLGGRVLVDVSGFYQKFKALQIEVPNILYLDNVASPGTVNLANFSTSVDAKVYGVDLDTSFKITPRWQLAILASYASGKVLGSGVPCTVLGTDGQPTFNAGGIISFCPGKDVSTAPKFTANIQTNYEHPLFDKVNGFVRGVLTYAGRNSRVETDFTANAYSLLALYAGLRASDGAWQVSAYARNALNNQTVLDTSSQLLSTSLFAQFPTLNHATGYRTYAITPRREIGINVRFAFGSR